MVVEKINVNNHFPIMSKNEQAGTLRFLLYNIRYGAGFGRHFHFPLPYAGYLKQTNGNLNRIVDFIKSLEPDVIGLVEVDSGSYRCQNSNQAEAIAREMQHDFVYRTKYAATSIAQRLPLLKKQGNALLTNRKIKSQKFHYLCSGVKRLVIELELEEFIVFLVHLSLGFRKRRNQLADLQSLVTGAEKPVVVAGDFNVLWGVRELEAFLSVTGLQNMNRQGSPSHPSRSPRRQLDFILCSPQMQMLDFRVLPVGLSDHAPLICDFQIARQ
jgi:endonuclease/exonuclease/phosphatase family metal-dependent hydrolase